MLKLHISLSPRTPHYQVKAVISIQKIGAITDDDHEELRMLRTKLEQIVPGNIKIRYNLSLDQLAMLVKAKDSPKAQAIGIKLTEYIRAAITALQLRLL